MTQYQRTIIFLVNILKIIFFEQIFLYSLIADSNSTAPKLEIIRIVSPGFLISKTKGYVVRMRTWGVSFPKHGQPGFDEAVSFSEKMLLSTYPSIEVVRTFDEKNLKVVKVVTQGGKLDFSLESVSKGIGWHNEEETARFGPLILAQLKAKRGNLGIWKVGFDYSNQNALLTVPKPNLPDAYMRRNQLLPQISYWVTSFGKIHRPGCSFYQRGRGTLMSKPNGTDCRICGGMKGKR